MTLKETIKKINHVAYDNFEVAEGMLEIVNDIMGTKFGWLNRRVVIFDNPDASIEESTHTAKMHGRIWIDSKVHSPPRDYGSKPRAAAKPPRKGVTY